MIPSQLIQQIDRWLLSLSDRLDRLRLDRARRAACALIDPAARLYPTARIDNHSAHPERIMLGAQTHIRGELMVFQCGGEIRIGELCYLGEGSRVWARTSIRIGHHVLISHLVDIHDTNSHPLDLPTRRTDIEAILLRGRKPVGIEAVVSAPVVIEDDVWIGCKATILKGVTVGRGAIVAAGAVVTKNVAPFTLVAGNPARLIRALPPISEAP